MTEDTTDVAEQNARQSDHDPPIFELRGVGVDFATKTGLRPVLRDLSLSVAAGEFVSIVGRSGTGKTTLLRVLGGLLRPTRGTILLNGHAVTGPPADAVVVFQDYANALLPWRTVRRNVALGLEGRMGARQRNERVDEALRMVGLEGRDLDRPRHLSGGMQQRVQIARAVVRRPKVLLMDEPFGALDAMTKANLQDSLLNLAQQTGATILFITHDIDEAIYLSDRVVLLGGQQPSTISEIITTGLTRPRRQLQTRESPRFLEARHQLALALHGDEDR
ncbi:ABC transporter ATP-binding protein [Mycobacterium deserti]|uniref:ABC transporter ATP-binding protein n=1 Tax=Mycobacterium deserti TaxID=2978347 RepID=A0ABT2MEJ7_9MYCO|nr:ABC transporter ATP-binding protein [Mycobacterium deserti]MCT7660694.1 ABC transporter ATP-binding protein [Mycobacterium deserti]